MANTFPSTTYACPCSSLTSPPPPSTNKRTSIQPPTTSTTTFDLTSEQTFNPHSPRADHALYPLDHLLYCDECDAIRCPRCWTEEVLYWYCPSCLFEVPSSAVRGDGNRCSRSCYDCPSCTAPLAVTQIPSQQSDGEGLLKPPGDAAAAAAAGNEAFVLQCQYCDWSSLEIGVQFSRATKITEQLVKQQKMGTSSSSSSSTQDKEVPLLLEDTKNQSSHDDAFTNLTAFYKDQLSEACPGDPQNPYSTSSPYSSPANLARIMSLYGGLSYNALKKSREKPQPMREAMNLTEGLTTYTATAATTSSSSALIQHMQELGWEGSTTSSQRHSTPQNNDARFVDQLWPAATPLRTRRGRRCKSCRQFLTRPEQKVGSMRYKIRLLALNYIPRLSLRPLHSDTPSVATGNPAFHLRPADVPQENLLLHPGKTTQYILTLHNPLFERVRISLATPATTPGRVASRVTILCPSFTLGPAGDVWDEALDSSSGPAPSDGVGGGGGRRAAMASLTAGASASTSASGGGGGAQPEAGKIWDRTRNSTSVILEVVPGSLLAASIVAGPTGAEPDVASAAAANAAAGDAAAGVGAEEEDEDVLEIPIYVRAEWEAEESSSTGGGGGGGQGRGSSSSSGGGVGKDGAAGEKHGERVRKEVGYWVVLGVGRIG